MSSDGTLSANTSIAWNVSVTNLIDYLSVVCDLQGNTYYALLGGNPIYNSDRSLARNTSLNTINLIKLNSQGVVQWVTEIGLGLGVNVVCVRLVADAVAGVVMAVPLTQISNAGAISIKNADGTSSGYVVSTGGKTTGTIIVRYDADGSATSFASLACCGTNLTIDCDSQNAIYINSYYANFESTITSYTFNGLVQNSYTRQDTMRDTQFLLKLSAGLTPLWIFTITGYLVNQVGVKVSPGGTSYLTLVQTGNSGIHVTDSDSLVMVTNTQFNFNNSNTITVSDPTLATLNTFLTNTSGVTMLSINSTGKFNWATTVRNVQSNFGAYPALDSSNRPYFVCAVVATGAISVVGMSPNNFSIPVTLPTTGTHTLVIKLQSNSGVPIWTSKLLGSYLLASVATDDYGNIAVGTVNNTTTWQVVNADGTNAVSITSSYGSVISFDVNTGAYQWGVGFTAATPVGIDFVPGVRKLVVAANMISPTGTNWFGIPTVATSEKLLMINVPAYNIQGSGGAESTVTKSYATLSLADNGIGVVFANQANDDVILFGNKQNSQQLLIGLSNSGSPAAITINRLGVTISNLQISDYRASVATLCNAVISQQLTASTVIGSQGNYSNVVISGKLTTGLIEVTNMMVNSNITASNHTISAKNVICSKLILGASSLTFG